MVRALLVLLLMAAVNSVRAEPKSPTLPPPLSTHSDLFGRYWTWLKQEAQAPSDLEPPKITIEPLPATVRMAFAFPTAGSPWRDMRVVVSPGAIKRAESGDLPVVLGELAHEFAHYVLVLAQNDWDPYREVYINNIDHHCDPEFKRLTRGIIDVLWSAYHSADTSRAIDHMVRLACWRDGHALSQRKTR